jgi:hypothetical protein
MFYRRRIVDYVLYIAIGLLVVASLFVSFEFGLTRNSERFSKWFSFIFYTGVLITHLVQATKQHRRQARFWWVLFVILAVRTAVFSAVLGVVGDFRAGLIIILYPLEFVALHAILMRLIYANAKSIPRAGM